MAGWLAGWQLWWQASNRKEIERARGSDTAFSARSHRHLHAHAAAPPEARAGNTAKTASPAGGAVPERAPGGPRASRACRKYVASS